MTFDEFKSLNDFIETERLSGDNHIYHYGNLNGKEVEIDENLETMLVNIKEI